MNPIAQQYFDAFYHSFNIAALKNILTSDLSFIGPLSRMEYVNALIADPPTDCTYEAELYCEHSNHINVIDTFSKNDIVTKMSLVSILRKNKIRSIVLFFDAGLFP